MTKLIDIEGIGPKYADKLKAGGVTSAEDLLKKGATPKGREAMAAKAGVSHNLILEWINHVDLFRIKGVGSEYADLLEETGVDTVPELAQRKGEHLFQKMMAVNVAKKLVRKMPTQKQVENWIAQAKKLPRTINY
jgi:predicted flap endonuclease-1-like 5' DNA nuclease